MSKMWWWNLHNYQYVRDNSLESAASGVVFSGLILPGDCLGGRPLRYPIRLRDCSAQPMIVQPPFKFSIVHLQCKAVLQGCTVLDPCSANGDTALQMSTHCSPFTWDPIDGSGCLFVIDWCFVDFIDVALADEDTNPIPTVEAKRAIPGNAIWSCLQELGFHCVQIN